MGFFSKLFGKKKGLGEDDGQAQYFKEDFQPIANKSSSSKAAAPVVEAKAANPKVKKPVAKAIETKTATSKTADTGKKTPVKAKASEISDDSPEVKNSATVKESKATANGKFDIRKSKDGRFFFSLYASNGAVIAYSQIYSSITAVTTGISSVITNAPKSGIEDTTLKKVNSLSCPKWEIYIDKAEQYRFRLYATNGQIVCHSSHGYASKSGCKGGIDSIIRFSAEARVDKSYLK